MNSVHVIGMQGMGDSVFARPAIIRLCELYDAVYLETCWPYLYADLPRDVLRLIPGKTSFSVQAEARDAAPAELWNDEPVPAGTPRVVLGYDPTRLGHGRTPAAEQWDRALPRERYTPLPITLPAPPSPPADAPNVRLAPYALVRYPVLREEWDNPDRDPSPTLIFREVTKLPFGVVRVLAAPFHEGERWRFPGQIPMSPTWGRPTFSELLSWVDCARVVITGPCFLLSLAAALNVPTTACFGGHLPWHALVNPDEMPSVRVVELEKLK